MGKTYRVFEVDSESGLATPVDNPKLNSGDVVLVGSVKDLGQKVELSEPDSGNKGDRIAK